MSMKRRSYSDALKEKGLRIACDGTVKKINDSNYLVRTNPTEPWYEVVWGGQSWQCQCRFDSNHQTACKHIYAVIFTRVLNPIKDGESTCPDCGSDDLVRKGVRKNKSSMTQRYHCRICGLNFIDRPGFYKMKGNARSIVASIDLYFKGLSLSKIQDHLRAFYGVKVTRPAIHGWIHRYVRLLDNHLSKLHPKLSKTWHADETKLNVNGQHQQLWNMLDNGTRFLIANHLSLRRRGQDAKRLIKKALATSTSPPKFLITDGLTSYGPAIQDTLRKNGGRVKHIAKVGLADGRNNIIESFHGTLRERTKIMRGLDNHKSAQAYAKGFRLYYNFVRPHSTLNGATPADAAGIGLGAEDNRWMSLIRKSIKKKRKPSRRFSKSGQNAYVRIRA